jgi:hypothetical protein
MKTFEKQAAKRLFKKLSALRATLSNEERAILDKLVGADEVQAHKMNTKINTKAVGKINSKATEVQAHKMNAKINSKAAGKINSKANEVQAHKMNTKINTKAAGKINTKADEVQAHKMNTKITGKAAEKSTLKITFDPSSEEYKLQE